MVRRWYCVTDGRTPDLHADTVSQTDGHLTTLMLCHRRTDTWPPRWYCVTDGPTPDLHVIHGLKRTPEIISFNVLCNPLRPALYYEYVSANFKCKRLSKVLTVSLLRFMVLRDEILHLSLSLVGLRLISACKMSSSRSHMLGDSEPTFIVIRSLGSFMRIYQQINLESK